MVELHPLLKRAYWTLAAGGLLYVLFVFAATYPDFQRLYVPTIITTRREMLTRMQCPLCQQIQP